MRKNVIWIIPIIFLLSCCQKRTDFSLAQSEDQVARIEIISVQSWIEYDPDDANTFDIRWTIDAAQHGEFLKDLYKVPCYKYVNDPMETFGKDTIRVFFLDGSYELIGESTVYYETATGDWKYPRCYFDREKFREFVSGTKTIRQQTGDGSLPSETPANNEP